MKKLLMFGIILLAFFFRFNNVRWDSNFHLHPDERFLTMVGTAMQLPSNILDYFDQSKSTLNPGNVGFKFYVYGVFPVVLNKILAIIFKQDNYDAFTLLGRQFSGFVDILVIILVYKIAKLFFIKKSSNLPLPTSNIPLWSAFLYAIAVLPIQLSHFFAVDSFLNFFMFASFYFVLKFHLDHKKTSNLVLSAIFFGFALASKITAVFILPLNLFFIIFSHGTYETHKSHLFHVINLIFYFLLIYFTLRIVNPPYFQFPNLFNPTINKAFYENISSLKSYENPEAWYPPGVQWVHKQPITFSLVNIAFFGLGIPYFILMIVGLAVVVISNFSTNGRKIQIILLWAVGFFLYQSTQYVKSMRYFIFLYPFFAIFAGIGIETVRMGLTRLISLIRSSKKYHSLVLSTFYLLLITVLLIWPLAFSSIYLKEHSRVAASKWIVKNLPDKSKTLVEHWDDGLPLAVQNPNNKTFVAQEFEVFGADTSEKWQKMNTQLKDSDYYILSSNRGWGSIPTVPERFPKMTQFYKDLLAGKTDYKQVAKITSYPSLRYLGIPVDFPDEWAEEGFTVYDHPVVLIYQKK